LTYYLVINIIVLVCQNGFWIEVEKMLFFRKKFKGGVPVPHRKNTAECATVKMGVPQKVVIPLLQHIGTPCVPKVKKGEYVKVGQVIGSTDRLISVPIQLKPPFGGI